MSGKPKRRRLPKPRGQRPSKKFSSKEFEPEVPCDVPNCSNHADKELGGRSIAFSNAQDVWSSIKKSGKRVKICRTHYKEWKKAKKDEPDEWT